MNKNMVVTSDESQPIALQHIVESDLERLREWKNQNRESFNYKELIPREAQVGWFHAYLQRPDDHMFIVKVDNVPIGCMGFRLESGALEIYNVILGAREMGGRGSMGKAIALMCSFIRVQYGDLRIGLRVLKVNPAVGWYKRNGFVEVGEVRDCFLLQLDRPAPASNISLVQSTDNR